MARSVRKGSDFLSIGVREGLGDETVSDMCVVNRSFGWHFRACGDKTENKSQSMMVSNTQVTSFCR